MENLHTYCILLVDTNNCNTALNFFFLLIMSMCSTAIIKMTNKAKIFDHKIFPIHVVSPNMS